MLLALTGAEKTGKTSLARSVAEASRRYKWHVVHLGARRPDPLDLTLYLDCLKMACRTDTLVIMDRGWADEPVYSQLLGKTATATAPALEWNLGRAVPSLGVGLLVTAADWKAAQARRDDTDYPILAADEIYRFEEYAQRWGWQTTASDVWSMVDGVDSFDDWVYSKTEEVIEELAARRETMLKGLLPPVVAGAIEAPRLAVVGEARNEWPAKPRPLAWLPFTGPTEWVREFCPTPWNETLWTNAKDAEANPDLRRLLNETPRVLAMGNRAAELMRGHPGLTTMPHPSAIRRWGTLIEQWPDERVRETWLEAASQ